MKQYTRVISTMLLATGCIGATGVGAATFGKQNTGEATITAHETATVSVGLDAMPTLHAGVWGAGTKAATLTVDILTPSSTAQHPAAAWTAGQTAVAGCSACRDIKDTTGAFVLPLKLVCDGATAETVGGVDWQYAPTGTTLSCSIEAARMATVTAGTYNLSLDAAMRTE